MAVASGGSIEAIPDAAWSRRKAAALFKKACDASVPEGCYELAFASARGRGVAPDLAQATVLYDKACSIAEPRACYELGIFYEGGHGTERNSAWVAQFLGFGPVLDGHVLRDHPFDPTAPAISRDKPLIVGYNRDEMNFFFAQNRDTEVYALTDATLKARLDRDLSATLAPACQASAIPSPVATAGLVVSRKTWPAPPVASSVAAARTSRLAPAASK
jgi:carboxylesterase type B